MIIPNRWAVEVSTPYEGVDITFFDDPHKALAFAIDCSRGGYSSAIIRPETKEWEPFEFEKALKRGEIV